MTTEVALLSVKEIGEELNNAALRNSCMKSTDPMARLRYLEVLLQYHETIALFELRSIARNTDPDLGK